MKWLDLGVGGFGDLADFVQGRGQGSRRIGHFPCGCGIVVVQHTEIPQVNS